MTESPEHPVASQSPTPATEWWRRTTQELLVWLRTLASAAVYATLIVTFGFQVARVEGRSMEPTLGNQDRLVVNKLAYRLSDPEMGDLVMLIHPLDPDQTLVKRIVAGPGDRISIRWGRVSRNGVPVDEAFVPDASRSYEDRRTETVPPGHYYVVGDNQANSSDSRRFGFVPRKYILGKIHLRWWPLDRVEVFEE